MDSEPLDGSRRVMLGLVLMAVLLIAGGMGLMAWDDRQDRDTPALTAPVQRLSVP